MQTISLLIQTVRVLTVKEKFSNVKEKKEDNYILIFEQIFLISICFKEFYWK